MAVVKASARIPDSGGSASYKVLYDKRKAVLVFMICSAIAGRDDFYHLRVYDRQTEIAEFQDHLPLGDYKGYPRLSQSFTKTEHKIPLEYPDDPEITEWPLPNKPDAGDGK